MVQHIRKKHPEYQYNSNSIQAPLAATVISSTPAVITTDGTTAEAVVVSNTLRYTRSNTTSSNQNIFCLLSIKISLGSLDHIILKKQVSY